MKFKDDFKTQAGISRAIAWEMTSHQQYFDLLEARLPTMADKGQAESLRIKLRILLEMLGESPAPPPRSAEGNTIENAKDFLDEAFRGMERDEAWFESLSKVLVAYASQLRNEVTDEEIMMEGRVRNDIMDNGGGYIHYPSFSEGAKWVREKMTGKWKR